MSYRSSDASHSNSNSGRDVWLGGAPSNAAAPPAYEQQQHSSYKPPLPPQRRASPAALSSSSSSTMATASVASATASPSSALNRPRPAVQIPNTSSTTASRKVLLRIPNAKASRWSDSSNEWTFLALGDFVVYQVAQAPLSARPNSNSGTSSPGTPLSSRPPPALPSRTAGTGAASPPTSSGPSPSSTSLSPSSSSTGGASGIVLSVRNTEFPLTLTTHVDFRDENTYILNNGEGFIVAIELETPRSGSHSILDNVLRKYTIFNGAPPTAAALSSTTSLTVPDSASASSSTPSSPELRPSDFKGSLLLIDEDTGKILGPLNQNLPAHEAANITKNSLSENANEFSSEDIVVSFPEGKDAGTGEVQISAFQDVTSQYGKTDSRIVGAAEYVSRGVLFAAEYGANYTSSAAKKYTEQTKATDTPLIFSQTTKNT
jgi:hypothetical protein